MSMGDWLSIITYTLFLPLAEYEEVAEGIGIIFSPTAPPSPPDFIEIGY
jgi:hypothetical protein